MPLRLFHVGFDFIDPNFSNSKMLSKFFSNPDDNIVNDIQNANVLVIGNAVKDFEVYLILNFTGIRLMYVGEPIGKFLFTQNSDEIFKQNLYTVAIGLISNESNKWIKYPSYYGIDTKEANAYVATASFDEKNPCTLINRHDMDNTRVPILRELYDRGIKVSCPGILANNCSNEELNKIGSVNYIRKFIFNICSENFSGCQTGYLTEKLVNCCLAGAIPIYFGSLDDVDVCVFNKERIIFLDHSNTSEVANRVVEMLTNREILEAFYRQPVFLETAEDTLTKIDQNIRKLFKTMSNYYMIE